MAHEAVAEEEPPVLDSSELGERDAVEAVAVLRVKEPAGRLLEEETTR
jgi:hypothetical protein